MLVFIWRFMRRNFLKHSLCCFLCYALCIQLNAQKNTDSLLAVLNKTISASPKYDSQKTSRIRTLELSRSKKEEPDSFKRFLKLYDEYQVFNYDSAYTYASKMQATALRQNDSGRIAYSKIKLSFILLSS